MAVDSEFVAYLLELLENFGDVDAKRMFGGFGIYRDGLMFGLVNNDTFFLKADDLNRPRFEELELPPFTYIRQGKPCALSFFQAPPDALEDPSAMLEWAAGAFAAARRTAKKK